MWFEHRESRRILPPPHSVPLAAVPLLRAAVKVALDPPSGIRAALRHVYTTVVAEVPPLPPPPPGWGWAVLW